ncbi:MAG: cell division protein FtsZ [Saprospiraceae bacterium]|nr:cell division protein FtsZ [Saprospiraceae bacterium]
MQFNIPDDSHQIIKVIGVGGGGSNAVSYMHNQGIVGVDFAICNTDNQAMNMSKIPTRIQLGPSLTEGRGAGSKPIIGREACIESLEEIKGFFNSTKMLFVTAGMGGGTGTGAAPVIAKAAREADILTVGIVTMPFAFEGRRRMKQALEGISELKQNVDTLIVISNDKLRKIYGNLSLGDAFSKADDILTTAAKGIAEIITVPGYVNVDFEDVNTVMRDSGVAVMGTAVMEGEDRARRAVEAALQSPLLEDNEIKGAKHILLNITSGTKEVTMDEVFEITEYVQEEAGYGTDLIWGNCYDENLGEKLSVTVIATGFETNKSKIKEQHENMRPKENVNAKQIRVSLDDDLDNNSRKNYSSGNTGFNPKFEQDNQKKTPKYSIEAQDPYIEKKKVDKAKEETEEKEDRRHRLRNMSVKLNDPERINELENQPAYLRRGVRLDEVTPSTEQNSSKWTLSDDDEPELKDNSFLHDNVD